MFYPKKMEMCFICFNRASQFYTVNFNLKKIFTLTLEEGYANHYVNVSVLIKFSQKTSVLH